MLYTSAGVDISEYFCLFDDNVAGFAVGTNPAVAEKGNQGAGKRR